MSAKDEFVKQETVLNTLYHKAVNDGPLATKMVEELEKALHPTFGHKLLKIGTGPRIGPDDSVYVVYASVPKGSGEIDALNAKSSPMISIHSAVVRGWPRGAPAPAKVTAHWFRGTLVGDRNYKDGLKFRKKTDSPAKIVKYIIEFFMKNKEALLDNERK
jgi:hypothetical protein